MGDWTVAIGILVVAIVWIQIFLDYRKKLMRLMPTVNEVSTRMTNISSKISQAETSVAAIQMSIGDMQKEVSRLEEEREDLQAKLNPLDMILVPAGKFRMGTNEPGRTDENPEHMVTLKAFYIDQYEVTNIQYKEFIEVTAHRAPTHWRNRTFPEARVADHPVVNVSWEDAREYASWSGKRMPTEAEWERAALGDGRTEYPWGKGSSPEAANFDNPEGGTTPVDKYARGKSSMGIWDMSGNVGEWVSDWYDDQYYQISPDTDPLGLENGYHRAYRGGGYQGNRMDIRAKTRHFAMPSASNDYIGFRCAMDSEED